MNKTDSAVISTVSILNFTTSASSDSEDFVTALDAYLPPLLIFVGTVCNLLVIKVMRSVFFRFVSTSVFITFTSAIDIFSLLVLLTVHWINANFPEIIYRGDNAHIMCKVFNFFGWGTSDLGILLTAGMTTERALAILFPMKAPSLCTTKKAKQLCVVIVVIVATKDCHFLITSDIKPISQRDLLCCVSSTSESFLIFWSQVWPWLHNVFLGISFLVIIVSNCVILRYIRLSDRMFNSKLSEIKRNDAHFQSTNQERGHAKRRQIAVMLLIASFTIVICTLPFSVYVTLESNISLLEANSKEKSIKHIISSICFYLLYVNRCGNFFLYCISGTRFRKSLKIVFCKDTRYIMSDNFELLSKNSSRRPNSMIITVSRNVQLSSKDVGNSTETITVSTRF